MSATPQTDMAFRVLRLEQQLESYQRLHSEELEEIRRALEELKQQILLLAQKEMSVMEGDPEPGSRSNS